MPDRHCRPRPAVTSLCRTPPKVLADRSAKNRFASGAPWCSVWSRDGDGERGLRVSLGGGWTWLSRQQANVLLEELQAALVRLEEREAKRS